MLEPRTSLLETKGYNQLSQLKFTLPPTSSTQKMWHGTIAQSSSNIANKVNISHYLALTFLNLELKSHIHMLLPLHSCSLDS